MAPPPPIVVATPYGNVRADSERTAAEFADLYEELAPRVRAALPGSQDREVDVWVQSELMVYRNQVRPESVRGFTLLSDEFEARRIHLKEEGQSSWYFSHELVHALIGEGWDRLPAILEEGLADVVAEQLNRGDSNHIRAHRLLNASAFTGGIGIRIAYSFPRADVSPREWERRVHAATIRAGEPMDRGLIRDLLETPRSRLHRKWPEMPEPFYGIAWLIVSRIVERRGTEGLLELCRLAEVRGHDLVPADWLLAAAEIEIDDLDATFLGSQLSYSDLQGVASLEPDLFAEEARRALYPWETQFSARGALRNLQPTIRVGSSDEVELSFRFWPLRRSLYRCWREGATADGR